MDAATEAAAAAAEQIVESVTGDHGAAEAASMAAEAMSASLEEEAGLLSLQVILAVVLAAVIAVFFFVFRGSGNEDFSAAPKTKVDGVVLLGPCGSGKTVIFQQLCYGATPTTITSMAPAYGHCDIPTASSPKRLQVVDLPGHKRLRHLMKDHVKSAKGVVVVVDASGVKQIKEAAQILFSLFTMNEFKMSTPMLIFCNKHDMEGAKSPDRVKILLEKELETMRKTHGTIIQTESSASDSTGRPLTEDGVPFKFDLSPFKTSFAAGAAMKGVVDGLATLTDFIVSST